MFQTCSIILLNHARMGNIHKLHIYAMDLNPECGLDSRFGMPDSNISKFCGNDAVGLSAKRPLNQSSPCIEHHLKRNCT